MSKRRIKCRIEIWIKRSDGIFAAQTFREAKVFEKAYLIHLFQHMIEAGEVFSHADISGGYREIDTQEDFELAQQNWPDR
mgnify:CR=1 FL=1